MKTIAIAGLIIIVFCLGMVGKYIGAYNDAVGYETQLESLLENNKNILSSHHLKMEQALQVSKLNASQVQNLIQNALYARYGSEGSGAAMQWIKENHPELDQSINLRLMTIMETGENEFKNAQTRMIDVRRSYTTVLRRDIPIISKGFWMKTAGFPTLDLNDFDILMADSAKSDYEKGSRTPAKLQ